MNDNDIFALCPQPKHPGYIHTSRLPPIYDTIKLNIDQNKFYNNFIPYRFDTNKTNIVISDNKIE